MTGRAATIRTLLETDDLTVGEFVCPPGDWRWHSENDIGEGFHVVFPWTPVQIARRAMPGFVATPNHAVLYPPRLRFHRRDLTSGGRPLPVRDPVAGRRASGSGCGTTRSPTRC